MQKTIPIEYDELILLYDSWLNYQAFLRYFNEEEHTFEEAKWKVIKANWDEVCRLLKETGAIKFEGDLFNAIAQTVDFLNQLAGMLTNAVKSGNYPENEKEFEQY